VDLSCITVEPLGRQHDRAAFHCGAEALDRYLKQQARQDADKRVAAPFVAVSPPNARVLGYYTLSASVLTLTDLPNELARKLPRYPQLPVTLLGRLAVDQSTKGPRTKAPPRSIGTTVLSPCRPSRAACLCRCAWYRSYWVSLSTLSAEKMLCHSSVLLRVWSGDDRPHVMSFQAVP
jgi:hypothetical protein